jgi:serine/threonine-protein phosphatase 2A regulatory subunit B'
MNDTFLTLVHESHQFHGAGELLDITSSIVIGFNTPLRPEHITFFKNILLPLHKVQTCNQFFEPLLRCTMLFVSKDNSLVYPLLDGLMKYWPFANYIKEVLFLSELLEALEVSEMDRLEPYLNKIIKRYIKAISSQHVSVRDRAIGYFDNSFFVKMLSVY